MVSHTASLRPPSRSRFAAPSSASTPARLVADPIRSLNDVQDALGHKNLSTTRVYVRRVAVTRDRHSVAVLALLVLSIGFVAGQSSNAEATVTVPAPFRTIHAVVNGDGSIAYGGAGVAVSPGGTNGIEVFINFSARPLVNPKKNKICQFFCSLLKILGEVEEKGEKNARRP